MQQISYKTKTFQFIYRQLFEFPTRHKSYDQLIQKLESSGLALAKRLSSATDTPENRRQLAHIVGIERWGQQRLKTLLGAPLRYDEYDGYRPDVSASLVSLCEAFAHTRCDSARLARELQRKGIPLAAKALHNKAGEISVRGWLGYFCQHAFVEGIRIR
jgi:hypothetical protein